LAAPPQYLGLSFLLLSSHVCQKLFGELYGSTVLIGQRVYLSRGAITDADLSS